MGLNQVHQLEDLKRKCLKKEKKAKGRATGVAAIWKVKTWGGAGGKVKEAAEGGMAECGAAFVEEPESAVVDEEEEDEEDEEVSCCSSWVETFTRTPLPT